MSGKIYATVWWSLSYYWCQWRPFSSCAQPSKFAKYSSNVPHVRGAAIHWIRHWPFPFPQIWRIACCQNKWWGWGILHWMNFWCTSPWPWLAILSALARLQPRTWQVASWCRTSRVSSIGQLVGISGWICLKLGSFCLWHCQLVAFFLWVLMHPCIWILLILLLTLLIFLLFPFFKGGEGVMLWLWLWCCLASSSHCLPSLSAQPLSFFLTNFHLLYSIHSIVCR